MKPLSTEVAMIKKISILTIILFLILSCSSGYTLAQSMELESKYAVLIDAETGEVLFEKNSDSKVPIASITKIMTMLIAMEKLSLNDLSLNDIITVTKRAADMGGSQLFLEEGEKRTVEELLYGIAVESGNDAAVALGEGIGGSYDAFIKIMNDKAKALGMNNSYFSTPCGLDDEKNYSTARDVAKMSAALLKYELIYKFINVWNVDITIGKNNDIQRTLTNTNKMLTRYEDIDGIKTGYTSAAGHCISVTSKKNDMRLIGVILCAPDSNTRFKEAAQIIDYGFMNFKGQLMGKSNTNAGSFEVLNSQNELYNYVLKENAYLLSSIQETPEIKKEVSFYSDSFVVPLKKEEQIGVMRFYVNGELYKELGIYPSEDILKCSFGQYIKRSLKIVLP